VYSGLPLGTLRQWVLEGRIETSDELQRPEGTTWYTASSLPELTRYFLDGRGSEVISGGSFGSRKLFGERREEELGIDLTPFIDVTFLLLIFFVVSAQFSHQAMRIDPPQAENTTSARQERLAIVIDDAGRIYLGQSEIALADLAQRLRDEMLRTKQRTVVIRGDKASQHGVFVAVLDRCKQAKVESILVGAAKQRNQ
jgi:biopolymer transport protein ExbD